jgi:hypothetical protein
MGGYREKGLSMSFFFSLSHIAYLQGCVNYVLHRRYLPSDISSVPNPQKTFFYFYYSDLSKKADPPRFHWRYSSMLSNIITFRGWPLLSLGEIYQHEKSAIPGRDLIIRHSGTHTNLRGYW